MKQLKILMLSCLFLLSTTGFAQAAVVSSTTVQGAGWDKLTDVQRTAILNDIATKAETASSPVAIIDKVDKYVGIGERIGKMVGGAAREVGMAVNDFAKTPVGIWAIAMITWTYMGTAIVHLVLGTMLLIVGYGFIAYIIFKSAPVIYVYHDDKTTWYGGRVLKSKSHESMKEGDAAALIIFACGITVIAIVIILTF